MTDLHVVIRTADHARKAEVALPSSHTGADVIQAAVDNWALPKDTDYSLVNTRTANPTGGELGSTRRAERRRSGGPAGTGRWAERHTS